MTGAQWLAGLVLPALLVACSTGGEEGAEEPASVTPAPTATALPTPTMTPPLSREERIRALLRNRDPDAAEILALAPAPATWTTGQDTVLVRHTVVPRSEWPLWDGGVALARVLDARGRVVRQWVEDSNADFFDSYHRAGSDFVWIGYNGERPTLYRDGSPTPLTRERARANGEATRRALRTGLAPRPIRADGDPGADRAVPVGHDPDRSCGPRLVPRRSQGPGLVV